MWLIDPSITWFYKSSPLLGQWPPVLARCDLSWAIESLESSIMWSHYIAKGASPVSQRQGPSPWNWVELWVTVKGPHLFFQLTWQSRDYVFFEKRHIHRRKATELLEIPNIEKLTNQKLSLLLKKILTLDSYRYKPL